MKKQKKLEKGHFGAVGLERPLQSTLEVGDGLEDHTHHTVCHVGSRQGGQKLRDRLEEVQREKGGASPETDSTSQSPSRKPQSGEPTAAASDQT